MNISVDFGDIITRAWQITWRNRGLWILGILASCLGNRGGNTPDFNLLNNNGSSSGSGNLPPGMEQMIEQLAPMAVGIGIGLMCVILLLSIISAVLGWIGRGGLIAGARLAEANGKVTFGETWASGTGTIGKQFGLWLFTGLPFLIISLLIIGALLVLVVGAIGSGGARELETVLVGSFVTFALCLIPLACILGLAGIVANILNHMGTLAAVIENRSGMDALRRGWEVLRSNFLSLLILGVIIVVLGWIFSFVVALPIFITVLPVFFGVALAAASENQTAINSTIAFAVLCCAVYVPILWVLQGIFETWAWSAWTLIYGKLIAPPPAPPVPAAPPSMEPAPVTQ
ncbi:MAG: hypothetical protein JNL09_09185 [Anaerolineales bacterium]|nr:hypothetical protein [Anaerolineales bacterium]